MALLRESPFHIDSLLQLSEVSKHNGDNGLAGEFIGTHLEFVLDSADIGSRISFTAYSYIIPCFPLLLCRTSAVCFRKELPQSVQHRVRRCEAEFPGGREPILLLGASPSHSILGTAWLLAHCI